MMFLRPYNKTDALLGPILELLSSAFPSFADREGAARLHGLRWERCSTPFVVEERGEIIAHVGLLGMTFIIDGVERSIGGIHAVATRHDHRGRGHAHRLLEEAVAYGLERFDGLVLAASVPRLYQDVGFEVVQEHRFTCFSPPASAPATKVGPWLDWESSEDLALLHQLLERRQPLSDRLSVVRERDVFLFNTARSQLLMIPELDCIAWTSSHEGVLVLHDLLAEQVPTLEQLLAHLQGPFEQVVAEFCPDRLDAAFEAEPHLLDGDDYFMALGDELLDSLRREPPIAIARSSRC